MKHFICITFVLILLVSYVQAEETLAFIELKGHTGEINFANFSPDGKKVVTGGKDETVRIWDAETGKELRMLEGHRNRVDAALFSPDGKKIVTKDGRDFIRIWDAETGKMLHKLEEQVLQGGFGIYNPNPIAVFSPDSKKIFTAGDGDIDSVPNIRDTESGKVLFELKRYWGPFLSVIFSPDGKKIAMSGDTTVIIGDAIVIIWDVESGSANFGKKLLEIDVEGEFGYRFVTFSPDGKKIVTAGTTITMFGASGGDKTVRIRDAETGKILGELVGHTGDVCSATFSPDGKKIVTSSLDNTVRIWNAETDSVNFGRELKMLEGNPRRVCSAEFSSDGKKVITHGYYEPSDVQVWDAETGKELRMTPPLNYVRAVSPDGRKAVTIGWNRSDNVSVIQIWDLERLLSP